MGVGRSPVVPEKRALEDAPGPISAFEFSSSEQTPSDASRGGGDCEACACSLEGKEETRSSLLFVLKEETCT